MSNEKKTIAKLEDIFRGCTMSEFYKTILFHVGEKTFSYNIENHSFGFPNSDLYSINATYTNKSNDKSASAATFKLPNGEEIKLSANEMRAILEVCRYVESGALEATHDKTRNLLEATIKDFLAESSIYSIAKRLTEPKNLVSYNDCEDKESGYILFKSPTVDGVVTCYERDDDFIVLEGMIECGYCPSFFYDESTRGYDLSVQVVVYLPDVFRGYNYLPRETVTLPTNVKPDEEITFKIYRETLCLVVNALEYYRS